MDMFFTVTYCLFIIHLVRTTINWLYLWQMKEYRLDRILVHVRETRQGRSILFGFEPLAKTAVIFFYFFTIFYSEYYLVVPVAVFSIYAYELLRFVVDIFQKKVALPTFTPKMIMIAVATFVVVFLALMIPLLDKFFWLVFVDKTVLWVIGLFMGLFSFPSIFYKDTQINKAITKLRKHRKVLVIGITGSYGKGSTKEYMHAIISTKFNTLKTPSTHNTPIGIARSILSNLTKKTEIFIVEMGAYKKGEIAEMCEFVQPKIGVLTAVNDQHISLFGSIKNTKAAKYELIESLPPSGIALFNGNNDITQELFTQTRKRKKYLYYAGNRKHDAAHISAHSIKVHPTHLTFDAKVGKEEYKKLRVDLVGSHNIQNILPGVFVGQHLKMTKSEISSALRTIKPLYKTMEPFNSETGALYIDDTFNANPASVLSAVDYLSNQRGKKGFVLQPMIELGKNGKNEHRRIGKSIGKTCTHLFLTNKNYYKEIMQGIKESGNKCEVIISSPKKMSTMIAKTFGKKDVVVFEGKESQKILDLLPHTPFYMSS